MILPFQEEHVLILAFFSIAFLWKPLLNLELETANDTKSRTAAAASPPGAMEDTPAYAVLQSYRLLETMYRKERFEDLFDEQLDLTASSSNEDNWKKKMKWGVYWTPGCGFVLYVSQSSSFLRLACVFLLYLNDSFLRC
jgi:hypothetical protein